MNSRRKLIIAFGAGALMAPFAARAQQPVKVWRVGYLGSANRPVFIDADYFAAFESRWAGFKDERLPELAAELVRLKVDVIVAQATSPVAAAKRATSTIPIVMTASADPVGTGLVASLARR